MHVCTSKSQGEPAARSGLMLRSSRNPFLPVRCVVTLVRGHMLAESLTPPWERAGETGRVSQGLESGWSL